MQDTDKFEEAIESFEQSYRTIVMPGEEAVQVLNEFKTNQYEEAIKLLNTYSILREEREKEMLARQEAEKKFFEVKNMEECLCNQEQQSKQAIDQLKDESERMLKEQELQRLYAIDQQKIEYEQMLNQIRQKNQTRIDNLQNQLNNATKKKTSFWDNITGLVRGVLGGLAGGLVRHLFK
ncbi:45383_t:CDS:2 [Gigaspora margarita]|uniref:45383_t:CDS:1 n=1 Tax=Gigaspora margarita TaxID=4874 RepID=A0ABN7VIK9_GIGMA|nr:45383_t:CDS:2 [Gigaspora margarita]